MILAETSCSVRIIPRGNQSFRITISEHDNHGLKKARGMVEESIIEFLNDENSNGRLLYELSTNANGSINFDHIPTADGFVLQQWCDYSNSKKIKQVWMKLLELPYAESNESREWHGKFLLNRQFQEELTCSTDCSAWVYGFGETAPIWCDPYVLIRGQRKEEVILVAVRVSEKLRKHAAKYSLDYTPK